MTPYQRWQKENYGDVLPEYDNPFQLNEDEERDLADWKPFDHENLKN